MKQRYRILKPTKQKKKSHKIFGFDVETEGKENKFVLACIYGQDGKYQKHFTSKKDLFKELCTNKIFRGAKLIATNLHFDFFQTIDKSMLRHFSVLFNAGRLLCASTKINPKKKCFQKEGVKSKTFTLTFEDSMNHDFISVEKMGQILGIPKLPHPKCFARKWENMKEFLELRTYCMRDCEVTYKYIKMIYQSYEESGATVGITVGQTSLSNFTNNYLKEPIIQPNESILLQQLEGFYGGRTEAFARGYFEGGNDLDVNSLYPTVMAQDGFPNPRTMRISKEDTTEYIQNYEGLSFVHIECDYMFVPFLPLRYDNKLIFPYGKLSGWYSHNELRHALTLGYRINKVEKTYYYKQTEAPFKEFIHKMYNKRLELKKINSPQEKGVKLQMNSLFGKWGQKWRNKDKIVIAPTMKELEKSQDYECLVEEFDIFRLVENRRPPKHSIPIWACYITAKARILMYEYIKGYRKCIYTDTDSSLTFENYPTGEKLGEMKLELKIIDGFIVKPKFYMVNGKDDCFTKIKGISKIQGKEHFMDIVKTRKASYTKLSKFSESMRRNIPINMQMNQEKNLSLEDTKRKWNGQMDENTKLEWSEPWHTSELEGYIPKTLEQANKDIGLVETIDGVKLIEEINKEDVKI